MGGRRLELHLPKQNMDAFGQCRDALDQCRDVSGKSMDACEKCRDALGKCRDVSEQCMDAWAKCRDVSAANRVLNPESMDVLVKCRDVSVKSMPATPWETSASHIGSATHAADMETERSPLPAPRDVVIRMFTIDSPFARIATSIHGNSMPAHTYPEPDRRMTRTSWGGG
jgi:hypothetical protein